MIISVTITSAGSDSGPFDIYSNSTGSFVLVQSNVSKAVLFQGYTMTVPDGTTVVRVESKGECTNYEDIIVDLITTTTTSTTTIAPTTTTTTAAPTTTTTTETPQAQGCIDVSYNSVSGTTSCLGNPTPYTTEFIIFTLKDANGNPINATTPINIGINIISRPCYNVFENVVGLTIPIGQSSVQYSYTNQYVDCGQGECVFESEEYLGIESISGGYTLCEQNTTTTTTVAPTTARLDYQVTLAGGISYGTFNISVNGTNVYNTNATDSGYIDVPINSSIEVNIYAPPGEAEATFNSQVFANNSSGNIASNSGPNASATITFIASEDTSIVGTATTSGSNGVPVIQ